MSAGPALPPPGGGNVQNPPANGGGNAAPAPSKLHTLDWVLIAVATIALIVYGVILGIGDFNDWFYVNWLNFLVVYVISYALLTIGYIMIRTHESAKNDVSLSEFGGLLICILGALILAFGGLHYEINAFFSNLRIRSEMPDLQSPVVRVTPEKDIDILNITRIAETQDRQPLQLNSNKSVRVYVQLEIPTKPDATNRRTIDDLKIPSGLHGKAWYEIDGQRSLGDDF